MTMAHFPVQEVPKWLLTVVNNLYEVERKLQRVPIIVVHTLQA
jgi:hypothetical protein